jgi:hypothetical protein
VFLFNYFCCCCIIKVKHPKNNLSFLGKGVCCTT